MRLQPTTLYRMLAWRKGAEITAPIGQAAIDFVEESDSLSLEEVQHQINGMSIIGGENLEFRVEVDGEEDVDGLQLCAGNINRVQYRCEGIDRIVTAPTDIFASMLSRPNDLPIIIERGTFGYDPDLWLTLLRIAGDDIINMKSEVQALLAAGYTAREISRTSKAIAETFKLGKTEKVATYRNSVELLTELNRGGYKALIANTVEDQLKTDRT